MRRTPRRADSGSMRRFASTMIVALLASPPTFSPIACWTLAGVGMRPAGAADARATGAADPGALDTRVVDAGADSVAMAIVATFGAVFDFRVLDIVSATMKMINRASAAKTNLATRLALANMPENKLSRVIDQRARPDHVANNRRNSTPSMSRMRRSSAADVIACAVNSPLVTRMAAVARWVSMTPSNSCTALWVTCIAFQFLHWTMM